MTTLHVIDAFTNQPFCGNPAAVCVLKRPADAAWMQFVSSEMNLAETAFLHPIDGGFSLRWFTPTVEVALCGHATLASAFALWELGVLQQDQVAKFSTLSGWLTCTRDDDWIEMDFPASSCEPTAGQEQLDAALGVQTLNIFRTDFDLLAELSDEEAVANLQPNMALLSAIPVRGVIVTAPAASKDYDFVSRFFGPNAGVPEDPVTGSAHCALAPYWMAKLGKPELTARQISQRGGTVKMRVAGRRVMLRGQAVMMSRVELFH
jgi:PhzF family phenazine biosynthesis protein